MILKQMRFLSAAEVVDYVNIHNIKKTDIQDIEYINNTYYVLFYWEKQKDED